MFRRLGVTCLFGAALLLIACKSKSQETPAAPPPSAPAPTASAPAAPPAPAPVTDDTLSFVEKAGDKCKWVRLEALHGTRKDVFTFDGPCDSTQLAWSRDGLKGSVLLPAEEARPGRAWTVELVTGQGTALPLPEVGSTTELGFDSEGRLLALVAHYEMPNVKAPERVQENGQEAFVFEGQKYPIDVQDGTPGLAHAFRREGNAWKRVETKVSSYGWDLAAETSALDAMKQLGPNTALEMKDGMKSEPASPGESAALDKSLPAKKAVGEEGEEDLGSWARFATAGGPVYYREQHVEFVIPTMPVRWAVEGKLVEPEKLALPEDASVALETRGGLLLVSSNESLRLYDVKQKKLVLSRDGVFRQGFWPRPEAPGEKAQAPAAAVPAPAPASAPAASNEKLDNSQAVLGLLLQSPMKLEQGKEACAGLAKYGTVAELAKKARADSTDSLGLCDFNAGPKTWSCKAEFTRASEDPEAPEFLLHLQYTVDDASRTLVPGSLVCRLTGSLPKGK